MGSPMQALRRSTNNFLHQLAAACERRCVVQLRRYHAADQSVRPRSALANAAAAASVGPSSHAAAGIDLPVAAWDSAIVSTSKRFGRGVWINAGRNRAAHSLPWLAWYQSVWPIFARSPKAWCYAIGSPIARPVALANLVSTSGAKTGLHRFRIQTSGAELRSGK